MSESLNLTPEETSYFKQLFKLADTDKDGKIGVQDALFLTKSGLPKTVLGKIWTMCDSKVSGALSENEFYLALRLVALVQQKQEPTKELALKPSGKLPSFPEYPPSAPSPVATANTSSDPFVISPSEREQFLSVFDKTDLDHDGFVTGAEARNLFSKSGLSNTDLAKIWALSDVNQDTKLDKNEFCIAMFLIQAKTKGKINEIPSVLPPSLHPKSDVSNSISSPSPSPSPSPNPTSSTNQITGPIPADDRTKFIDIFKRASNGTNFVNGEQARKLFSKSGLSNEDLGKIWILSDIDKDNKLNEEEFCLAMFFINSKLKGKPIPDELHPSLKPQKSPIPVLPRNYDLELPPLTSIATPPLAQGPISPNPVSPSPIPNTNFSPRSFSPTNIGSSGITPSASPRPENSSPIPQLYSAPQGSLSQVPSDSSLSLGTSRLNNKKDELEKDLQQLQMENEQTSKQVEADRQELERLTNEVKELEKIVEEEKTKKIGFKEQLKYLQLNLQTVKEQKDHFDRILKEKSESLSEEQELYNSYQTELNSKKEELTATQKEIEKLTHELEELRNKRKSLRNELSSVKTDLSNANEKKKKLQQEKEQEKEQKKAQHKELTNSNRSTGSPSPISFSQHFDSSPFQPFGSSSEPHTPFENSTFDSTFDFGNSDPFGTTKEEDPFTFSSDLKGNVDTQVDSFGEPPTQSKPTQQNPLQNSQQTPRDVFSSSGFGFGSEFTDTGADDFG